MTPKIERFAREYLIDLNGTQAAIRAGYSARTAGAQAHMLLKKLEVQALITKLRQESAERLDLTRDKMIQQYQRIGFSDVRKLFDAYGQIKPVTDLDDDTAAAIQGIDVEVRQIDGPDAPPVPVIKVRLADRKAALDSIMKAQGWNEPEKHEHTGKDGGEIKHAVRVVMVPPKQKAVTSTKALPKDGND